MDGLMDFDRANLHKIFPPLSLLPSLPFSTPSWSLQPDPSQRPSAAVLLTHPRFRSRLERELLKEKMKSKSLAKALVQNQQQQSKGRKLERTQTY